MVFLDVLLLQQPEMYLSGFDKMFQADGALVPATAEFLGKFMAAFAAWVHKIAGG
ncbi:MAG: hypothetical protein QM741_11940 [Rudaea sp.]